MKKKMYSKPQTTVVKMEMAGMLALSTNFGGDATEPARSPLFDDEFEE